MVYGEGEGRSIEGRLPKARRAVLTAEQYAQAPAAHENNPLYVFGFENNGKELAYVGCSHTVDPESPIFTAVREQFETLQPKKVLVEGMPLINASKEKVRALMRRTSEEEAMRQGESMYALWLAVANDTEFESAEPDDADLATASRAEGFSEEEMFFKMFYTIMHQYLREHEMPDIYECRKYIGHSFDRFRQYSGIKPEILDALEDRAFDEIDLTAGEFYASKCDPIPWEGSEPSRTKELSAFMSLYRDQYALERIASALKSHGSVMVVFGRSHAICLEPAIRELFRD